MAKRPNPAAYSGKPDLPLEEDFTPFTLLPTLGAAKGFAMASKGMKALDPITGALSGAGAKSVGKMVGAAIPEGVKNRTSALGKMLKPKEK